MLPRAERLKGRPTTDNRIRVAYPFSVISPSYGSNISERRFGSRYFQGAHLKFPIKLLQRMLQFWVVVRHYQPRPLFQIQMVSVICKRIEAISASCGCTPSKGFGYKPIIKSDVAMSELLVRLSSAIRGSKVSLRSSLMCAVGFLGSGNERQLHLHYAVLRQPYGPRPPAFRGPFDACGLVSFTRKYHQFVAFCPLGPFLNDDERRVVITHSLITCQSLS